MNSSSSARCPVCGEPPRPDDMIACKRCLAPHHPECWDFSRGCSLFGCGSIESVSLASLGPALPQGQLIITETTRAPIRLDMLREALARKLLTRSRDLPRTILAGLGGAAFSVLVYLGLAPAQGNATLLYTAIFLTGLAYGLISPFLAPTQHRHPGLLTLASLLTFAGLYFLGHMGSLSGTREMVIVVSLFFTTFLFASSAAEALAGTRSRLAERLGGLALPVRLGLTWGFAVALMLAASSFGRGDLPQGRVIREIMIWGLMAIGTVVPALEQGKSAYRERLPEGTD